MTSDYIKIIEGPDPRHPTSLFPSVRHRNAYYSLNVLAARYPLRLEHLFYSGMSMYFTFLIINKICGGERLGVKLGVQRRRAGLSKSVLVEYFDSSDEAMAALEQKLRDWDMEWYDSLPVIKRSELRRQQKAWLAQRASGSGTS